MEDEIKVKHVKCKSSVALTPNNFATNAAGVLCAYLHRNEAHVIQQSGMVDNERVASTVAPYPERDPLVELAFAKFAFADCLLVVNLAGGILIFDEQGEKLLLKHKLSVDKPKQGRLCGIASDSKHVAVGSGCGTVYVFSVDSKSMKLIKELELGENPVTAVTISANHLVAGDDHGAVVIWELGNGKFAKKMDLPGAGFPCTSLRGGHGYVCGGFSTGHLRLYNLQKGMMEVEITAHTRTITAVAVHPTRALVACASDDTFVSVWGLPKPSDPKVKKVMLVSPNSSLLTGVGFLGNGLVAAVAYDSRYISMMVCP